ncbi:MAG: hypothetical protein ABJA49_06705 [Betaproteobacteria bacterium]
MMNRTLLAIATVLYTAVSFAQSDQSVAETRRLLAYANNTPCPNQSLAETRRLEAYAARAELALLALAL